MVIRIHCISLCLITSDPLLNSARLRCRFLDLTLAAGGIGRKSHSFAILHYCVRRQMAARWTWLAVDLQYGTRRILFDRIRRDRGSAGSRLNRRCS